MERVRESPLAAASQSSAEDFAEVIYRILLTEDVAYSSKNEPTSVELARSLASESLLPAQAKLRAALAYGARTWNIPNDRPDLCAGIALLFRKFSSRELAIALAQQLLAFSEHKGISANSAYADLFVDAVLAQAADASIRARCVDLALDPRFQRFVITIFVRLTKVDVTSIPFIMKRVFEVAPQFPTVKGVPGYMIAFDRDLNLSDVSNILSQLSSLQVPLFYKYFLAYSASFITQSDEMVPLEQDYGPLILEDEKKGGTLSIDAQAAVFLGGLEYLWEHRKEIVQEMAERGVESRPLLAA